ncbi:hypothetical protein [Sagittula marina]|uniref:hypothetical protein n=1 Tax=Sagittula marina TaxID=943940 RepID=UPI0031D61DA8
MIWIAVRSGLALKKLVNAVLMVEKVDHEWGDYSYRLGSGAAAATGAASCHRQAV